MEDVTELIRRHQFTNGLSEEIVALIAGCAKNVVFEADEYVFREQESADFFYLIRHGTVALEMFVPGRGPFTFLTIKSGEILGASWLIPPYRWAYDARAVEVTRAIAFECGCLRDKCESDPRVGYELMKRLVPPLIERLKMARLQNAELFSEGGLPQ